MGPQKKSKPADIRVVLKPKLADAVRDAATDNHRTMQQELIYRLEITYGTKNAE